jgi:hypothetical protein
MKNTGSNNHGWSAWSTFGAPDRLRRPAPRAPSIRHLVAAALAATAVLAASAGCKSLGLPDNRLMSCESSDDCKKADPKKPACYNLRCVECGYDSDCESGVCTNNQCKTLFKAGPDDGPEGPPANLDACLARCKEQACFDKCNAEFRPAEPPKK